LFQQHCKGIIVRAALATMLALVSATHAVPAGAAGDLSDGDKTCLGCHAQEGFAKDLGEGKTLSLQVPGEAFAKSVHLPLGCAGCHSDIKLDKHPQATKKIRSAREYSIAMVKMCGGCHEDASKQNAMSIHATRLKAGNESAPVCTDCHSTHAIIPKTAYDTCVACHATAMSAHQKWLPNAGLHLEVVSCAACHAPAAKRMVDLRLYDGATRKWVTEKDGAPGFEKLARAADADGNGLDAAELRNLMAQINRDATLPQKTLRGRVELRTGAEAHQLSDKTKAIKECATCHRQGAEPFQTVTVSIISPDGKPLRYDAHKDVLSSVLSVESLREFYAVGGTRNSVLDILFVLAVLGGLAVPIGHQILKRIVKRQLAIEEANKAAAGDAGGSGPGAKSDGGDTPTQK
jgi:hypothetical protein